MRVIIRQTASSAFCVREQSILYIVNHSFFAYPTQRDPRQPLAPETVTKEDRPQIRGPAFESNDAQQQVS